MTTFFGGPGFGGPAPTSREMQALQSIDSRTKSFVNKDFVKNIQWLNTSVDTLSVYTQKLQQGVDAANQNALEHIQGIVADLIVIFAGGEPTGINLGDLKYIFQALGALLGINPDTVFPLNLLEAAYNLFTSFIVPLPQFTDIIFDALIAWAEWLGFTDEAIAALRDFNDAVIDMFNAYQDLVRNLIPALNQFLKMLGFGTGWLDIEVWRRLIQDLQAMIDRMLARPREILLNALSMIIVTVFKALTWLVNVINPRNLLSMLGLQTIGPELAPDISSLTTIWQVGSNPNSQWVYDATKSSPGTDFGSFRTNGNAFGKRILTQGLESAVSGDTYTLSGWLLWQEVPTNSNQFGPCIVWYRGLNEVGQSNIDAPTDRDITGGWEQVGRNVIVPGDADGFRIGYRVSAAVGWGTIWAGRISCSQMGIGGFSLANLFGNWVPWDIFKGIPTLQEFSVGGVNAWFRELLTPRSPINADMLFGFIPDRLFGGIPVSALLSHQPNLLENPGFDTASSLSGQDIWHWDEATGHDRRGSTYVDCDGTNKELFNTNIIPVEPGMKFQAYAWARWAALSGFSTNPIRMGINEFVDEEATIPREGGAIDLGWRGGTGTNSGWVQLQGNYTVPEGVSRIKFRLQVRPQATGGRVHFDDIKLNRANLLQWNLVDELESSWNSLMSALGGWWGAGFSDIINRLRNLRPRTGYFDSAWLTNIFNIPSISDLSVPGLLRMVNDITDMLFGWIPGVGRSREEARAALEAQRQITMANQQALQEFLATLTEGNSVSDNFNRRQRSGPNALGPLWHEAYTVGTHGEMVTNNRAEWRYVWPGGNREGLFIWQGDPSRGIPRQSSTHYQRVAVVLHSAAEKNLIGECGHNDVICRWMPGNSYIRWRVSGDNTWELARFVDGVRHQIYRGILPPGSEPVGMDWPRLGWQPAAGTFINIFAGDKETENLWYFKGMIGPELIWEWEDLDHITPPVDNPDSRGWGMGVRAEGTPVIGRQMDPGAVAQWFGVDQ